MNAIVNLLCRIAGVRKDAIARAPHTRHQAATMGIIMLITAVIASITMGYAIARAFVGDRFAIPAAILGGCLWGTFVLVVDRLILISIDKVSPKRMWLQAIPRLTFAVAIGLAISKPVVLRVAQTVLDRELHTEKRSAVEREAAENAKLERLDEKSAAEARLQSSYEPQQARLQQAPDSYDYITAVDTLHAAETHARNISDVNSRRIARAQYELTRLAGSDRSDAAVRASRLRSAIGQWQQEISSARAAVGAAQAGVTAARQAWLRDEQQRLTDLGDELKTAKDTAATSATRVAKANAESESILEKLHRTNLANEYTTLKRIQANPAHPDSKTLRTFEFALDILFILIEITPILSKLLARSTPLDDATAAVEDEDRERINVAANAKIARMQKEAEVSVAVYERALEAWRDTQIAKLKQARISSKMLQQIRDDIAQMAA